MNKKINISFLKHYISFINKYQLNKIEITVYNILLELQTTNGIAKIRQSKLAERVNRSVVQIKRIIKKLVRVGLITATRKDIYSCNEYMCKTSDDKMYIPIYKQLLEDDSYTYNDKYAFCYLYNKKIHNNNINDSIQKGIINDSLEYVEMSTREIAEYLKCSMQTARNTIKSMVAVGLIEDIRDGFRKGKYLIKLKSIYTLLQSDDDTPDTDTSTTVQAVKPVVTPVIHNISNTVKNTVSSTVEVVKNTVKNTFVPVSDDTITEFINQIRNSNNQPVILNRLKE